MLVQRSNFIQVDHDVGADMIKCGYDEEDVNGFVSSSGHKGATAKVAALKATPLDIGQLSLKYCKERDVTYER